MVLILKFHGISCISLCDTQTCHHVHDGAVSGAAVYTGYGCGPSALAGDGNGLLVCGATGGIGGDGSGLVGSTACHMSLLFLVYLASELV